MSAIFALFPGVCTAVIGMDVPEAVTQQPPFQMLMLLKLTCFADADAITLARFNLPHTGSPANAGS